MTSSNFEFQRNLPFAEFIENNSWLQRRDPGAYLFGFILFFVGVLMTQSWYVMALAFVLCITGIVLSRISPTSFLNGMVKAIPFIIVIALINLFINPIPDKSQMVFEFWIIKISSQDINQSLILIARFVVLLLAISLTTANFSISRFIHGLEDLLSPLSRMNVPVQDFIVSVEIAIRYIPILTLTAERIAKAQASRGASWGTSKGSIIEKIRQVVPLIVPLFVQSFQKAEKIALAMDARGYGVIKKRSRYYSSRVKFGDVIFVIIQVIILTFAISFQVHN